MSNIIIPYTEVRIYRPEVDYRKIISGENTIIRDKKNRENVKPSEISLREIYNVHNKELKGLEHEETALFGHVAEVNIGSQPSSILFRRILPNDHVEIYYENMGHHDIDIGDFDDSSFFDKREGFKQNEDLLIRGDAPRNTLTPKFKGSVWKADLIQKPSQLTTKVGAWGYLRMLQYVNVPKSFEGREREVSTMIVKQDTNFRGQKTDKIMFRNDFLDYVDNIFKEYLKNLGTPSLFSKTNLGTRGEQVTITHDSLIDQEQGNFYVLAKDSAVANSMTNNFRDYLTKLSDIPNWTIEKFNESDDIIEKIIPEKREDREDVPTNIYSMIRFLDLSAQLKVTGKPATEDEPAIDDAIIETFRITGDIIVMDQFFLAELLTAGITMDHGINTWYSPVITFSDEFKRRMKEVNQGQLSNLIYIKLKIGRTTSDIGDDIIKEDQMDDFITFNLDTFNIFQYLNELIGASLFQQNRIQSLYEDFDKIYTTSNMNPVDIISIIFSNVADGFPQSIDPNSEKVLIDIKKNLEGVVSGGKDSKGNKVTDNFVDEVKTRRKILSENVRFMHKFLNLDDNMIQYIKNIPASYIRQDVYQGSQFKVATSDSLSLPRVIQLIATSMKGYPATNSPETAETKGNINNYSIFLANRVILNPKIYYALEKESDGTGDVYICDDNLRGKVTESKTDLYMFLVLEVSYKTQVSKEEEIEYEIDVGDVNDLEIIKGATQNHFFNFSLDKNTTDRIQLISQSIDSETDWSVLSAPDVHMFLSSEESVGVSPSEFQTLTVQDMTQDLTYDAIRRREVINGYTAEANETKADFPIYDIYIQANEIIKADPNLSPKPSLQATYVRVNNRSKNDGKLFNLWRGQDTTGNQAIDHTVLGNRNNKYGVSGNLLSVQTFVDFTDILDEIKYLKTLSDDPKLQYRHIANADEPLFENIHVVFPFKFIVEESSGIKRVNVIDEQVSGSLKKVIDDLSTQFFGAGGDATFSLKDMAWNFPVKGQVITVKRDDNNNIIARRDNTPKVKKVDLLKDETSDTNDLLKSNLIAIYLLDLLVKGIRYLLWSIAKSRFTSHVYTPIEHIKQGKDYQRQSQNGKFGQNDFPISAGSSVRFIMDESNTFLTGDKGEKSAVDSYDNDMFSHLRSKDGSNSVFEPHPLIHVNRPVKIDTEVYDDVYANLRSGLQETQEEITQADLDRIAEVARREASKPSDAAMIWYVSKKIIYIGESGMMMRLLMTEGSFDWTLFFREDTVATRISENYLLSGMGNFFLRNGDQ